MHPVKAFEMAWRMEYPPMNGVSGFILHLALKMNHDAMCRVPHDALLFRPNSFPMSDKFHREVAVTEMIARLINVINHVDHQIIAASVPLLSARGLVELQAD